MKKDGALLGQWLGFNFLYCKLIILVIAMKKNQDRENLKCRALQMYNNFFVRFGNWSLLVLTKRKRYNQKF